jgi:hypothetical protein
MDVADEDDGDDGDDVDDGDDGDDMDAVDDADDSSAADDADEADAGGDDMDSAEASEEYSEDYEYFESSESMEAETYSTEWSASVEWTETTSSQWGYHFSAPQGGKTPSAASLGLTASDGWDYPYVWQNNGGDELFDTFVLAAFDNGADLTATEFGAIASGEEAGLHDDYPQTLVEAEHHMLGDHKWLYSAYGGKGGEVDKFSTVVGSRYYSFYFFGPGPGNQEDLAWSQMASIVSSFDL